VSSPGTYTLAPYETNGMRALRILRDAASGASLWVEYRQPIGDVDSFLLNFPTSNVFAGALIRYADPVLDDPNHTYLLDFNPSRTPNDFMTAAMTPGQTWSDPYSPLTLTVNSATPQGLSMTVGYDSQCAALGSSSTPFPSAGGAGTINVTAPPTCSWTASAAPSWITLTGPTDGSGNGSVSFTVAANGGTTQRSGSITVGRQSVTVSQGIGTLTVEGMSPQSGSGPSAQLTFHFSDSAGTADIASVNVMFAGACSLTANPGGWVWLGSGSFHLPVTGASASSGPCTVSSDGSSIVSTGNELTVTLNMSFAAPLNGTVRIAAQANGPNNVTTGFVPVGSWTVPSSGCTFTLSPASQSFGPAGGPGQVAVGTSQACSWTALSTASWLTLSSNPSGSGNGTVTFSVAANPAGTARSAFVMIGGQAFAVLQGGSRFVPVSPCRIADTRNPEGPFGGPSMAAGEARAIAIPQSGCGIPVTAQAYSLNVTVVPQGYLGYLTLWPTGQPQPSVSTLNSWQGIVVANAAIVPAGADGAVSVFVPQATDVILDINGYFDSSSGQDSLGFYPATPCRVADTRAATDQFGGPSMNAGQTRDFPIPMSACSFPARAQAYALNFTVVPRGYLGFLSTWPTGVAPANVSTLNSWTGKVVANAAIVPAGTNESISVYVSNPTDVILDVNGYFGAPSGANALSFYPVTPCRVADTRGAWGLFGGPEMEAGAMRSFWVPAGCNIPSTAAAYSLNVTAVPDGYLAYLSVWPAGSAQPGVSTLNSWDGTVVANAAIVPAGTNGAISIFVTNPTHVILDINGYFAP
jgi:hypothetical protein